MLGLPGQDAGLAGVAGAVLLTSPVGPNRLQPGISNNIGWDGLLVALVARNRPIMAIPVALLFVLRSGGGFLAATGVPHFLVDVVKSLLVLAFVVPPVVTSALRRRSEDRKAAASADALAPEAKEAVRT